ncbi:TPA: glycosyltransferase, partial [Candidatus Micrarchaeota archaeon]|nr:glycosyltransferase [Candidatus Micrarchaeota archaeon]
KTSHEFETIIVDSYSKDATLDIAKEFTDRIFSAPPGIIGLARQKGSEEAKGEVIISAGADNIYDKNWMEELLAPIADGRCIATAGKLIPHEGNFLEKSFSEYLLAPFSGVSLALNMPLIAGESMAFTKKSFDEIGGYNTTLVTGEDIDLIKRLMKSGKVCYCSKSVTYVSTRRIRQWGYPKYLWFHGTNFFKMHISGRTHEHYEPVR